MIELKLLAIESVVSWDGIRGILDLLRVPILDNPDFT